MTAARERSRPRASERSSHPHPFAMTWRDGAFLHWPVEPAVLESHVPDPLELDTRDGQAWCSVVPFVLARTGVRGTPGPARLTFPEVNLRTYVRHRGDGGLFFLSIDVDTPLVSWLGRLTRLPVHRARMRVDSDEERVRFASERAASGTGPSARFAATVRPRGESFRADPDTLDHFLTARRRFYAPESGRGVLFGEIAHESWLLRRADATVHENTLFEAEGLPTPTAEPVVHFCGELAMTGSVVRRLRE